MPTDETHQSTGGHPEQVAAPIGQDEAIEMLQGRPVGAFIVAAVAVALLFIGWIAFYFFLFVPRGPIG